MPSPLLLDRDGVVATITLNRPDALNTLDFTLMDALVDATAKVAADDGLRVVVIRGAGKHFMAGGDLRTFAGELGKPEAERTASFRAIIGRLHSAIEALHRMPHPVVARVHGAVAGFGLSLMNACDLAIAADDTYFASAYRNIGLTPDGGGSWALPRLVGIAPRDGDPAARRALRRAAGAGVGSRESRGAPRPSWMPPSRASCNRWRRVRCWRFATPSAWSANRSRARCQNN